MLLDEVKGTLCSVPPPLWTTDFHDFENLLLWAMSLLPPFKNDAPCLKTTFNATKAQGEKLCKTSHYPHFLGIPMRCIF